MNPSTPAKTPKASKVPPAPKPPKVGARRRQALDQLGAELAGLRTVLEESLEQFQARLHGRLADLHARVNGEHAELPPLTLLAAQRALALIEALRLKPRKGRVKDLVHLADLVDELRKLLGR
jgi:hypothetical protein